MAGPQIHGPQQGGRSTGCSCLPALKLVTFAVFAERLSERQNQSWGRFAPSALAAACWLDGVFCLFFPFQI